MAPKKIALVTDSCADLSRALIEENDIHVIPLRIRCADGEFSDGVDISAADVYTRAPCRRTAQDQSAHRRGRGAGYCAHW